MLKKWLPWALKLAMSGALIWYLLRKVDLAAAWDRAQALDPGWAALSVLLMMVQIFIAAGRWLAVLKVIGARLGALRTTQIYYISCFFNLVLPGSVGGDAVRIWKACQAGLELSPAVNSVMLDRVITVFGLVLLVVLTQPILMMRADLPAAWLFPALAGVSVAGIVVLMLLDRLPATLNRWALVRAMAALANDTRRIFLHPVNAVVNMAMAVFGHAMLSMAVYALARGLDIDVSPFDCMALVPPVVLIMTLPISISGWGVRETAMVVAFGLIGVDERTALVLSVLFGFVMIVSSLPGGAIWLLSGDRARAVRAS